MESHLTLSAKGGGGRRAVGEALEDGAAVLREGMEGKTFMLYDHLCTTIKENESRGDFTYAKLTDNMLAEAETRLNLKLPSAYRWFLTSFGQGGIGGIDVLRVGKTGKLVFVEETLKYRSYGLPADVILIENCDEWVYCIQTQSGRIGMWSPGDVKCKDVYESFEVYLWDRINDILENRI